MKPVLKSFGHEFELVFEVEVDGVAEREVFGALYGQTDVIEPWSLSTLQKEGKAGRCTLDRNGGRQVLTVPMSASPVEAALLAAAIESIDRVGGRPACFKLVKLRDRSLKRIEVARRARELMTALEEPHLLDGFLEPQQAARVPPAIPPAVHEQDSAEDADKHKPDPPASHHGQRRCNPQNVQQQHV